MAENGLRNRLGTASQMPWNIFYFGSPYFLKTSSRRQLKQHHAGTRNHLPRTIKITFHEHPKPSPEDNQNNIIRIPETAYRGKLKQHHTSTRNCFPHTIKTTSHGHPKPSPAHNQNNITQAPGTACQRNGKKEGRPPRCGSLPLALFRRYMPQAPPTTAGLPAAA